MNVTVDKFGRIVIPKRVRDALDLHAGSKLEIEVPGDRILLSPQRGGDRLVLKEGVLVYRAERSGDIEGAVEAEREARIRQVTEPAPGNDDR